MRTLSICALVFWLSAAAAFGADKPDGFTVNIGSGFWSTPPVLAVKGKSASASFEVWYGGRRVATAGG